MRFGCDPEYMMYLGGIGKVIEAWRVFEDEVPMDAPIGTDGDVDVLELRPSPVGIEDVEMMESIFRELFSIVSRRDIFPEGPRTFCPSLGGHIHLSGDEIREMIPTGNTQKDLYDLTSFITAVTAPFNLWREKSYCRRANSDWGLWNIQASNWVEIRTPTTMWTASPLGVRETMKWIKRYFEDPDDDIIRNLVFIGHYLITLPRHINHEEAQLHFRKEFTKCAELMGLHPDRLMELSKATIPENWLGWKMGKYYHNQNGFDIEIERETSLSEGYLRYAGPSKYKDEFLYMALNYECVASDQVKIIGYLDDITPWLDVL